MPPIDDEGQLAQGTGGEAPGGEAKTTPTGSDPSLADLEEQLATEEANEGPGDGETDEGQSEDDELEDFEDGGKKAKLPKWVKDRVMQQADYTRKTMAIAERGKALEVKEAQLKAAEDFQRENVREIAKVVGLDEQLGAYEKVNWDELFRTNPQQHQVHFAKFQMLERERNKLVGELQQKAQQKALESQQEIAKRYEASLARIAKEIPNFEEVRGKLNEYAINNGYSVEELERHLLKPYRVSTLYKAFQFDQLMARARAKAKQPQAQAPVPVIQTVQTRRPSGSAAPRDSDDINTWMAKERARVAKRAGA